MAGVKDCQLASFVISRVAPSLKVATALNCCVWPIAVKLRLGGDILTSVTRGGETFICAEPTKPWKVALTLVLPADTAVRNPVPVTVATAGLSDPQLASFVTSRVVPSLKTAVAVSCIVWPMAVRLTVAGPMRTSVTCGGSGLREKFRVVVVPAVTITPL